MGIYKILEQLMYPLFRASTGDIVARNFILERE